ncbi:hypothetical protein [Streptomyces sp. Midd1]|uniref:hypothetical protein n=1 Tax=Streptomyces sp. Midd3 TaxID=3161191 RepID=UPI0034DB654C
MEDRAETTVGEYVELEYQLTREDMRQAPDTQSLVLAGFLAVMMFVLQPWLTARQFHKIASRNGAYSARVDDSGATVSNTGGSSRLNWTAPRTTPRPPTPSSCSAGTNASPA